MRRQYSPVPLNESGDGGRVAPDSFCGVDTEQVLCYCILGLLAVCALLLSYGVVQ